MKKKDIVLFLILFLGLFLRLYGNNWDQGWHLHPDERFLTMVSADVQVPNTVSEYIDPIHSSFNPVNKGHTFFVYGTFPLLVNKILAQQLYNDTYDQFNLQGRMLSGFADFLIILIIYKLVRLVEKKLKLHTAIKYSAAFLYAIAVFPIQLSHFFAVDTFLSLFAWLSIYFAVKTVIYKDRGMLINVAFSGIFFGLSLACKVSAVYIAPLIVCLLGWGIFQAKKALFHKILLIFLFFIVCYSALRLGSPYYFDAGSFFNPSISKVFLGNIKTLKSFDDPNSFFPPGVQWISKSYDFAVKNIVFFGLGPFYFLFSVLGLYTMWKGKNGIVRLCVIWAVGLLVYQSVQYVKTMRYLILLYPFFAICAAVGVAYISDEIKKHSKRFLRLSLGVCLLSIIVWPLAFMSIYTQVHSRVTASKWMYATLPPRSIILTEYWDDPLPLMVQDPATRNYIGQEVHIFDPDSKRKWQIVDSQLKNADYYIMSSNRGWGSITQVPDRYPLTSQFYKDMLNGKRGYSLVKNFTSPPSLRYLGIPVDFPDQLAEEAFTVYDHPQVLIFKKN